MDSTTVINKLRSRMCSLDDEYFGYEKYGNKIIPAIRNSYIHGESNSLVIIGKRGSGKTHLIKSLLRNLGEDNNFIENMYQVHLNGLLQTDDKMGLRSIATQLKCHLIEDDEEEFTSDNFNENFKYILSFLKSGNRDSISLLFIIEELDLFLQHKNQILIYNLLNSVQSSGTPIFFLGTTTRLDFMELMEKRVKSRFSHWQINLIPFAETFELYVEAARRLLSINPDKSNDDWNQSVTEFCEEPSVLKVFEQNYFVSNTIPVLKKLLMVPISRLSPTNMRLDLDSVGESWRLLSLDYKAQILNNICQLDFTFLAVLVNCVAFRDSDINFEMVYHEYQEFSRQAGVSAYDKNVLRKSLDTLVDLDLVGIKKCAANVRINFQPLQCFVRHGDLLQTIKSRSVSTSLQNYIKITLPA